MPPILAVNKTVRLAYDLAAWLEDYSRESGKSQNQIANEALEAYKAKVERKK